MSTPVVMPDLGESVTEATIVLWRKSVGDTVAIGEPLLEVSTDKVDIEIDSPAEGVLRQLIAAEDELVRVGEPIAIIDPPAEPEPPVVMPTVSVTQLPASALVASTAAARGVDLDLVTGSGVTGRIRVADIESAAPTLSPSPRHVYVPNVGTLAPLPTLVWPTSSDSLPETVDIPSALRQGSFVRTHFAEIDLTRSRASKDENHRGHDDVEVDLIVAGAIHSWALLNRNIRNSDDVTAEIRWAGTQRTVALAAATSLSMREIAEMVAADDTTGAADLIIELTTSEHTDLRVNSVGSDQAATLYVGRVREQPRVVRVGVGQGIGIRSIAPVALVVAENALSDAEVDEFFQRLRAAIEMLGEQPD
jgi:pyruvate/2-oxoglutarate dehydrogenase complex dihydrolipoamide acyltransferase (E2) component